MKEITIKRIFKDDDRSFGVVMDADGPFAVTVENPWLDNKPFVSCIPEGSYICERVQSPKFGNTFEIAGVPGRTHILFHWGVDETSTAGCVIVAEEYGVYKNHAAVFRSKKQGFKELMDKMEGEDKFIVNIENYWNGG